MSIDFAAPSYRAGSSDLAISISPLGLVELSDEEFEVHGPRLNRYSQNWAFYLGHHWSHRREMGEPQATFNYYAAFVNYLCRFTFGKGVHFTSPKETEAIIPDLLQRVWEVDNDKLRTMTEIGTNGGVSGDSFIKVAYEEPYTDPIGRPHVGKVRILPLNSAHCFPEFHPHDRHRLLRFKLKYRFWGTSPQGTRAVYTYTEIITDAVVEEYVNDELIDSRPNGLGMIPVVHIPNIHVPGSPWGLSDCQDVIDLNRQYNEVATDVADIVNYHAAPITIITGAKASQLEKGAKKVWAGLPKDAQVFNLEGGGPGLQGALQFLEMLKRAMHEMAGIPVTALGEAQPISNTSGVALSIQFQPLMNRWVQKSNQYGEGFQRINELVLLTLAMREPNVFVWDEERDAPLKPGQLPELDLDDPISFLSEIHWPPPLPLDKLVVLNEIQSRFNLGLESREGALRTLGEEFPDEKLSEIRQEQIDDALSDGALQLIKAQISKTIMDLTGMSVTPDGSAVPMDPMMGQMSDGDILGDQEIGTPDGVLDAAEQQKLMLEQQSEADIRNRLVTEAYGTKVPGRKPPGNASESVSGGR